MPISYISGGEEIGPERMQALWAAFDAKLAALLNGRSPMLVLPSASYPKLLGKSVPSSTHPQAGEQFFGALIGFPRGITRENSREGGVIEGGQSRKQGVGLQEKTDPPGPDPAQLAAGKGQQIRSFQFQRAVIRPGEGAEQGHERGFAGTGTPADGNKLRRADFQRDGLHGRDGAAAGRINPGKVAGAQDGFHSRPSRMS